MVFVVILLSCVEQPFQESVDSGLFDSLQDTSHSFAPVIQEGQYLTENLGETCLDFDLIDDYRWLCIEETGVWLIDETTDAPIYLGQATHAGGTLVDGQMWVHLDGQLFTFDTELEPVHLDLPVPIERLVGASDSLWLWGINRLFQLRAGQLQEVVLSETLPIYDFGVGMSRLWVRTPWLVEIDISQPTYTVLSQSSTPIEDLQVDQEGSLWWISSDQLYRQDGLNTEDASAPVTSVDLPSPPLSLHGPMLWISTANAHYRVDGGIFYRFEKADGAEQQVDPQGRLIYPDGDSLMRTSLGRPVVVVSPSDTLTVQEVFYLLPSDPDTLDSLRVWLDTAELPVETNPWRITLDPEEFDVGAHELRFWTESDLGDGVDTHPIWFGELPDVQWSDVEQISEVHCLSCHGGATLTTLVDKSDWMRHIDTIIHEVSTEGMPLGGPFLNDSDITTIRAWKAGGFQ
ncbi:MAG: hypothetical protein ACON4U_01885 [Myxococcota bacterium]